MGNYIKFTLTQFLSVWGYAKLECLRTKRWDPFDSVTLRSGRQWGRPHLSVAFGFSTLIFIIRIIIFSSNNVSFHVQPIRKVRSESRLQVLTCCHSERSPRNPISRNVQLYNKSNIKKTQHLLCPNNI